MIRKRVPLTITRKVILYPSYPVITLTVGSLDGRYLDDGIIDHQIFCAWRRILHLTVCTVLPGRRAGVHELMNYTCQ